MEQNIEIAPKESVSIHVQSWNEAFEIELLWDGETYFGDTGYIQDNRNIIIELLENMHFKITVNGKTDTKQLGKK